jgi:hypothetical protein
MKHGLKQNAAAAVAGAADTAAGAVAVAADAVMAVVADAAAIAVTEAIAAIAGRSLQLETRILSGPRKLS